MPRSSAAWSTSLSRTGCRHWRTSWRCRRPSCRRRRRRRARSRGWRVLRHVGNPAGLALGEEQVPHRLRLDRHDAVGEQLDFASRAPVEIHRQRRPRWRPPRRTAPARRAPFCRALRASAWRRPCRGAIADPVLQIASAAALPRCGTRASRKRWRLRADRRRSRRRRCPLRGPGGGDRLPSVHISSASRRPAQAAEPLCAPGTGNDPEEHLGLAHLRGGHSDAVVARHGELEAAAKRVPVNGGDERLAGVLQFFSRACTACDRSTDCSRVFNCLNTLMSAPAMNVVPARSGRWRPRPSRGRRARRLR